MEKRKLKTVIIKDELKGGHLTKWVINYYLTTRVDTASPIITTIDAYYLVPNAYRNALQGTDLLRAFKDKILLHKVITLPEIVFNQLSNHMPSQMEIKMIIHEGGIRVVKMKKS